MAVTHALAVAAALAAGPAMPAMHGATPARPAVETGRKLVLVRIESFAFRPARLVVSPGTKVVWENLDGDPHTVTAARRAFASEALDTHDRFSVVLRRPGTYPYICAIHPFMHGSIVVRG